MYKLCEAIVFIFVLRSFCHANECHWRYSSDSQDVYLARLVDYRAGFIIFLQPMLSEAPRDVHTMVTISACSLGMLEDILALDNAFFVRSEHCKSFSSRDHFSFWPYLHGR